MSEITPQAAAKCRWFVWVGQPWTSCEVCGRPAWDHDGEAVPDGQPFTRLIGKPWRDGEADRMRARFEAAGEGAGELSAYTPPGEASEPPQGDERPASQVSRPPTAPEAPTGAHRAAPSPTPPLTEFLALYREDDNAWWGLSSGDHQNLFDAAIQRTEVAEAEAARLRAHLRSINEVVGSQDTLDIIDTAAIRGALHAALKAKRAGGGDG